MPARNPFFTGREKELGALSRAFAKCHTVALLGLGGVGKTQTAVEFAFRSAQAYSLIAVIRAESRELIWSDLISVAASLGLQALQDEHAQSVIASLFRALAKLPNWLLIFDNADNGELIKEFVPSRRTGHILLTSRRAHLDAVGVEVTFEIGKLGAAEARAFMRARVQRGRLSKAETTAISGICKTLDYLPLALEQAAAYIKDMQCAFADYLSVYHKRGVDLLRRREVTVGDTRRSITTTWAMNFEQISRESNAATEVLRLSAFMAADRIPLELCNSAASLVNGDIFLPDEIIEPLVRYSLVKKDPDRRSFSIHRLVQDVVRWDLEPSERDRYLAKSVEALESLLPRSFDLASWPLWEIVLSHVHRCVELAFSSAHLSRPYASLIRRTAHYLQTRYRYLAAEELYLHDLRVLERTHGPMSPELRPTLNQLVAVYANMGRHKDSRACRERAWHIMRSELGAKHPAVRAEAVLLQPFELVETESIEQVIRELEVSGTENGPWLPELLFSLVMKYQEQGKFTEADVLIDRIITRLNRYQPAGYEEDIADMLVLRATNLEELGDLAGARKQCLRIAAFHRLIHGVNSDAFAGALQYLAIFTRGARAERLYLRSLAILEGLHGHDNLAVADALYTVALAYVDWQQYVKAEEPAGRAAAIHERHLGLNNLGTQQCILLYAHVLKALSRIQEYPEVRAQEETIRASGAFDGWWE